MSAHPLVYLPFPLEGLAQTRDRRPLRKRERQSGYSYMTFSAFSQFTDTVLLHRRLNQRWVRHNNAAQLVYLDTADGTCEFYLITAVTLSAPPSHPLLTTGAEKENLTPTLRHRAEKCPAEIAQKYTLCG